jgi:tRNA (guanine-N7-)-methyltransferase
MNSNAPVPQQNVPAPGTVELEFGVAIPGRILPAEQWAKTALKQMPPEGPLDFTALFGRSAPLVVELGCGNARYTLLSALARPELNHFASDLLPAVIRYATRRANQRGLQNVRIAVRDAETIVAKYLGNESAREIHLYHPQPFYDPRDAGRRLVTPKFLAEVHRALEPQGLFVLQTDNPDYWYYMKSIVPAFFEFTEREEPWPDAVEGRTRREILARSRKLKIFRGEARKKVLSPEELSRLSDELPLPTFRTRGPWCELDKLEAEGGGGEKSEKRFRPNKKRGGKKKWYPPKNLKPKPK